jgi:hypothetical protein
MLPLLDLRGAQMVQNSIAGRCLPPERFFRHFQSIHKYSGEELWLFTRIPITRSWGEP